MKPDVLQIIECQIVKLQSLSRTGEGVWPNPVLNEMSRIADELLVAVAMEKGPSALELECYEKGDRTRAMIESIQKYK